MITVSMNADAVVLTMKDYAAAVPRAMVRAMNRAIASGRTAIVREMARDTGLKAKDIRDAIVMREATIGRPVASISASLKRLPLIKFGAKGPEPSRGRGRGVSYRLPSGKGRLANAFIATMGSGHRGVFIRKSLGPGTKRLPIRELFGPSLGKVFNKFRELGIKRTEEAFVTNFDHEIVYATGGSAPVVTEASGTD